MVVLALDTSQPVGNIAIGRDGEVLESLSFGDQGSHLVELSRGLDRLLRHTGIKLREIDRIALVAGPGSFTGLRIGMAFVKGIFAGRGCEVVTVSSLELLALPYLESYRHVCSMLDARKQQVYGAVFARASLMHSADVVIEPCAQAPSLVIARAEHWSPLYVGPGAVRYRDLLLKSVPPDRVAHEDAPVLPVRHLCGIAPRLNPVDPEAIPHFEPLYIRLSEAELKRLKPIDPHG